MRAWGSGSCSLHSRIPSIQDGRQGVWKEKGGAGGRARSLEQRSTAASPSRSLGPRRRVEGQQTGTRGRRGQREAGGVREGVRRGARPGRGAKREGKAEKEPGKKEVAGRGTQEERCVGIGSSALFGFLLSVRGGGAPAFFSPLLFPPLLILHS